MTDSANCEFDVDLQIRNGDDQFSVKGDHTKLVLRFPSVGCAVRVWRSMAKNRFIPVSEIARGVGSTLVETRIRDFEVARYRHRSDSDIIAKVFGVPGTQVQMKNLIMAAISIFGLPSPATKPAK